MILSNNVYRSFKKFTTCDNKDAKFLLRLRRTLDLDVLGVVKVMLFWIATPCHSENLTLRRNMTTIFRVKEYAKTRNQEKQVAS
jgi:hypothetical protein